MSFIAMRILSRGVGLGGGGRVESRVWGWVGLCWADKGLAGCVVDYEAIHPFKWVGGFWVVFVQLAYVEGRDIQNFLSRGNKKLWFKTSAVLPKQSHSDARR